MSAGTMKERISFRRQTRTVRADGGYDTVNSTFSTVWADVKAVSGREGERAGRLFGHTSFMVTLYASEKPSALSVDWLLRWETAPGGAIDMDVRSVRPGGGRALTFEIVAELSDDGAAEAPSGDVPAGALLWGGEPIQWGGEFIVWGNS